MTFEQFWQQFPKKVGKLTARRSWEKLSQENQQKALEAIVEHRKYWSAKGTEWEFICHASTWLNQERFEDELVIEQKENKRPPLPWYASDELTLAKGRELGLNPYAGESFAQFRARLSAKIGSQAANQIQG
jgi:DNA polymerase elongation subunit (family B)